MIVLTITNHFSVAMAERTVCMGTHYLQLLGSQGYLSSHMAVEYSCGTLTSPWRVIIYPGQKVKISLISFNYQNLGILHAVNSIKLGYGKSIISLNNVQNNKFVIIEIFLSSRFITDIETGNNVTIYSKALRETEILSSYNHSIDIQILTMFSDSKNSRMWDFLLKYEGQSTRLLF